MTLFVAVLGAAAAYLARERDLTLRLLAGWDLHVLPAGPPDTVLDAARDVLRGVVRDKGPAPVRVPPGSPRSAPAPPK